MLAASPATVISATILLQEKSGSLEPLTKRREGRECLSGKAMQDEEVKARAWTLVEEKSKNLEEG